MAQGIGDDHGYWFADVSDFVDCYGILIEKTTGPEKDDAILAGHNLENAFAVFRLGCVDGFDAGMGRT